MWMVRLHGQPTRGTVFFSFEGLYLDGYIDQKIRFLARDDEILKVEEMVSDEIVYENAWISGFSGKTVTVFIGNIQREFPVKGVLRMRARSPVRSEICT